MRWQEVEFQPPLQRLDVPFEGVGFVRRMPIHHQEYLLRLGSHEILQERLAGFGVEFARVRNGPKLSSGIDRTDDVEALALTGSPDHRSLAFESIRAPENRVRLKARLVGKENARSQPFGPSPKLGIGLLLPERHRLGVSLIGPTQGLLGGDVQAG